MRKITLLLSGAIVLLSNLHTANAIQVIDSGSKTYSCSWANKNLQYYIPNSSTSIRKHIYDSFYSSENRYISDANSKVTIWKSDAALLWECTTAAGWWRWSEVVPAYNWVVAYGANCTFNKPTNPANREVQFMYNVNHWAVTTNGSQTRTKIYYDLNFTQQSITFNNYYIQDYVTHDNECLNVELRYCGDGIYDPGNGETCDPNDPNHSGWGTGGCSQSACTPITTPPTCDGLSMNPLSGNAPLNSSAICSWTNVSSFSIACGNGQTINAATGTCSYAAAGTYTAVCTVNGSITNSSCQKTITVNPPGPSIDIDKRDANPADRDGIIGTNDSQTVRAWEKAVFKITVTNNGPEALNNLVLTDPVEPQCAWAVTLPGTYPSTWSNFTHSGNGDNKLDPGETFSYTCEKLNTTAAYTNTANVSGRWVTSGTTVTDTDPTVVVLDPTPPSCDGLTMNPLTGDTPLSSVATCTGTNVTSFSIACWNGQIINAATGTCSYPNPWVFTAVCTVNGSITNAACQKVVTAIPVPDIRIDKRDANNIDKDGNVGNDTQSLNVWDKAVFKIKVTNTGNDNLNTLVLTDAVAPNCGGNVTLPGTFPSTWSNFVMGGAGDHTNNVLEPNETFEYTCEKLNTTANYTNKADVCGKWVISNKTVCHEDPTVVKVWPIYDLALIKKIQGTTTTFANGAAVTFVIGLPSIGASVGVGPV